jgi:hypothetical protein
MCAKGGGDGRDVETAETWQSAREMVGLAHGQEEAYPDESFLRATQITHNTSSVTVTTIAAPLASAFAQLRPWRWRCEPQQTVPGETEKRREMAPRDIRRT